MSEVPFWCTGGQPPPEPHREDEADKPRGGIADDGEFIQVRIPDASLNESKIQRCTEFLGDLLGRQPLPATTAVQAALDAGFSRSTIRKAKARAGIVSHYRGTPSDTGVWWWQLFV